jgi:Flp pilus assembly protein CpaB
MSMNTRLILVVILGVLAITVASTLNKMLSGPAKVVLVEYRVDYVTPIKDIPAKTLITEDMLIERKAVLIEIALPTLISADRELKCLPEEYKKLGTTEIAAMTPEKKKDLQQTLQAYLPKDKASLIGQQVQVSLTKSLPILSRAMAAPKFANSLSILIPPGMRAMTIQVNQITGVGGFIKQGDYVDVIGIFDKSWGIEPVKTILQGVQVLSVGFEFSLREDGEMNNPAAKGKPAPGQKDDGGPPSSVKANPSVPVVTLAVTPEEAEVLTLVSDKARFRLLLRSEKEMKALLGGKSVEVRLLLQKDKAAGIKNKEEEDAAKAEEEAKLDLTKVNAPQPVTMMIGPDGQPMQGGMTDLTGANMPREHVINMYKGIRKESVKIMENKENGD